MPHRGRKNKKTKRPKPVFNCRNRARGFDCAGPQLYEAFASEERFEAGKRVAAAKVVQEGAAEARSALAQNRWAAEDRGRVGAAGPAWFRTKLLEEPLGEALAWSSDRRDRPKGRWGSASVGRRRDGRAAQVSGGLALWNTRASSSASVIAATRPIASSTDGDVDDEHPSEDLGPPDAGLRRLSACRDGCRLAGCEADEVCYACTPGGSNSGTCVGSVGA